MVSSSLPLQKTIMKKYGELSGNLTAKSEVEGQENAGMDDATLEAVVSDIARQENTGMDDGSLEAVVNDDTVKVKYNVPNR